MNILFFFFVTLGVMTALIVLSDQLSTAIFCVIFISSASFGIAAAMAYGGGV